MENAEIDIYIELLSDIKILNESEYHDNINDSNDFMEALDHVKNTEKKYYRGSTYYHFGKYINSTGKCNGNSKLLTLAKKHNFVRLDLGIKSYNSTAEIVDRMMLLIASKEVGNTTT